MAGQLPHSRLAGCPSLGRGINAIYPQWRVQRAREFAAALNS